MRYPYVGHETYPRGYYSTCVARDLAFEAMERKLWADKSVNQARHQRALERGQLVALLPNAREIMRRLTV